MKEQRLKGGVPRRSLFRRRPELNVCTRGKCRGHMDTCCLGGRHRGHGARGGACTSPGRRGSWWRWWGSSLSPLVCKHKAEVLLRTSNVPMHARTTPNHSPTHSPRSVQPTHTQAQGSKDKGGSRPFWWASSSLSLPPRLLLHSLGLPPPLPSPPTLHTTAANHGLPGRHV